MMLLTKILKDEPEGIFTKIKDNFIHNKVSYGVKAVFIATVVTAIMKGFIDKLHDEPQDIFAFWAAWALAALTAEIFTDLTIKKQE